MKPKVFPKDGMTLTTKTGLTIRYKLKSAVWLKTAGYWDCLYELATSGPSGYEHYSFVMTGR